MGFFDSLNAKVEEKYKNLARHATDTGLIKVIRENQQKIDDGEGDVGLERVLEIMKAEADRRGLYY